MRRGDLDLPLVIPLQLIPKQFFLLRDIAVRRKFDTDITLRIIQHDGIRNGYVFYQRGMLIGGNNGLSVDQEIRKYDFGSRLSRIDIGRD